MIDTNAYRNRLQTHNTPNLPQTRLHHFPLSYVIFLCYFTFFHSFKIQIIFLSGFFYSMSTFFCSLHDICIEMFSMTRHISGCMVNLSISMPKKCRFSSKCEWMIKKILLKQLLYCIKIAILEILLLKIFSLQIFSIWIF